MAAAGEAEVFAGDAHPLEVLRGGEHPLDQFPSFVLEPVALDERLPSLGNAIGQTVANRLQRAQVKYPGSDTDCIDAMRDLGVAECLAEEGRQLGLEAANLPAQLQSRLVLVDGDAEPVKLVLSQQSRHLAKV